MTPRSRPLLALVAATAASLASAQDAPPRVDLVHVPVGALAPRQWAELFSGRYDVAAHVEDRLEVIVSADDAAALDARGIPYDVAIEDLVGFYASRLAAAPVASKSLGASLSPPFGQGAIGGFYDFDEVVSVLDQLAAQYPTLVTARTSIGPTFEGRDIWAVKISDNAGVDEGEPEARFDSMHHSREPQSMQSTLWFMLFLLENYGTDPLATYLVDERELWFVPVVNPDGYVYNQSIAPGGGGLWRKNRRPNGDGTVGVDINRNYPFQWGYDDIGSSSVTSDVTYRGPSPASEPETQAMVAFLASRSFVTALTTHTYSDLWLSPFGYDFNLPSNNDGYLELGALATEVSGYEFGPIASVLYPVNGGTVDQDHGVHGTWSWTPEIGSSSDGFWPSTDRIVPLAEETLLGFQRTALAAGAFVHLPQLDRVEVGNGDGFFEAGEGVDFDLTARNSGTAGTAGPVTATLSSSSPWANVTDGNHDFGALASFTEGSTTLSFAIDGAAPAATAIPYELVVAYEGFDQHFDGEIITGTPTRFVHDPVELDYGWTAGVAGDDASTGLWERGDPIGTTSSGQPANPSDDASPAPGVECFVTGNGGGGGGDDDVDDGKTTLLSPLLDLSGAGAGVEVRYSRWYADLSTADDDFEVSISDDGGGSWHELETVTQTENEWTTVSFRVTDHDVAQTDAVQLRFVASDDPNNSVVEAGVDELEVVIYDALPRLNLYGSPQQGTPVAFHLTGEPGAFFNTFASLGTAQIPLGFGDLLLDPGTLFFVYGGVVPVDRFSQTAFTVGGGPGLPGTTVYFQALVVDGPDAWMSNRIETTILP